MRPRAAEEGAEVMGTGRGGGGGGGEEEKAPVFFIAAIFG
jgi:hypothetical protein